jgi:hypothetical protein
MLVTRRLLQRFHGVTGYYPVTREPEVHSHHCTGMCRVTPTQARSRHHTRKHRISTEELEANFNVKLGIHDIRQNVLIRGRWDN